MDDDGPTASIIVFIVLLFRCRDHGVECQRDREAGAGGQR